MEQINQNKNRMVLLLRNSTSERHPYAMGRKTRL